MGIFRLNSILHKRAESAITQVKLTTLKRMPGRRDKPNGIWIAVDVSILLHSFKAASLELELQGLLAQFMRFIVQGRRNNIVWVFVWDGRAPEIKSGETERRRNDKKILISENSDLHKELEICTDPTRIAQIRSRIDDLEHRVFTVSTVERQAVRKLMDLTGSIVLVAKGEADPLLAALARRDVVDFVLSPDTDMFPYGCPYVLRATRVLEPSASPGLTATPVPPPESDFFFQTFDLVDCVAMLNALEFTLPQFVEMCILSGCDYFKPRLAVDYDKTWPMTAYFAIRNKRTIEHAARTPALVRAGFRFEDEDRARVVDARTQFALKLPREYIAEESVAQFTSLSTRFNRKECDFRELHALLKDSTDTVCSPGALHRHWLEWGGDAMPMPNVTPILASLTSPRTAADPPFLQLNPVAFSKDA